MPVSDLYARIDAAVVEAIKDLDLTGNGATGDHIGDRVYSRLFPDTGAMPCVMVTEESETEQRAGGSTEWRLWRYPVRVFVADTVGPGMHERKPLYLRWRETIMDAFDDALPPAFLTVPEVAGCTIQPQVVFDPAAPQYQHVVTGMVLWFLATKPRIERV